MCARQLDGWEVDDDPLQEHLKHGSDCAWALLMSLELDTDYDTASMEDPTGERLTNARRSTFESIGWPHEGKRGWVCKIEKMVEAGWHFAPTRECEDYTSCVYCKLSLDGWEPKDDPFDEHHRRSPECPFFAFAGRTAPSKRHKQKRGSASRTSRTSKVSRISNQSTGTALSQSESLPDPDQSVEITADNSIVSIQSTTSTTTKAKRKAPARTKGGKAKKTRSARPKKQDQVLEPELQAELVDEEIPSMAQISKSQSQVNQTSLELTQVEPSYPTLPQSTPDEDFKDAESGLEADAPNTPEPTAVETGPPEKEHTPVPVKQISPIKEQSNPPRPTLSPIQVAKSSPVRRSLRISRLQRSNSRSSQGSDVENVPPLLPKESVRTPLSSPGATPPEWKPVDVEKVFKSDKDFDLFGGAKNGELSREEMDMTVQEWIQHIAAQAEEGLSQEGERIVSIFEREGQRALHALESIQCI